MRLRRALPIAAILFSLAAAAEDTDTGPDSSAEVKADRMHVDHGVRKARFDGNVRVSYGLLSLSCESMEVSYDDGGRLISLSAQGRVEVTRGDTRAAAGLATLDARQNLLVLEKDPVLVQGANRLEGTRISVELKTGRIDVSQAKGTFRISVRKKR